MLFILEISFLLLKILIESEKNNGAVSRILFFFLLTLSDSVCWYSPLFRKATLVFVCFVKHSSDSVMILSIFVLPFF